MKKLHFEYIIYHIIETYYKFCDYYIEIDILENAFDTFIKNYNYYENTKYNFDFNKCLKDFIKTYNIEVQNYQLIVNVEELFVSIYENVYCSEKDKLIPDYTNDITMYEALEIPIPLEETKEYFDLNKEIVEIYNNINKLAQRDINIPALTSRLNEKIKTLEAKFNEVTYEDQLNIYLSIAKYNENLKKADNIFENCDWYQTLFGDTTFAEKILSYSHVVRYYADSFSHDSQLNLDKYSTFINCYIIYLNKYIKSVNDNCTKHYLIDKLYHLLPSNRAMYAENYFINNNTLDGLAEPIADKLEDKNVFMISLVPIINGCFSRINHTDAEINQNKNLYPEIILNILFIKCYLNNTEEDVIKMKLFDKMQNSNIMTSPNQYKIVSQLLYSIIFENGEDLEKII